MQLLSVASYPRVLPLLDQAELNTYFAAAVLNNKVDGQVYVDDELNPSVAYIIHSYGMSLLIGDSSNLVFNQCLRLHWARVVRQHDEYLQVYPAQWENKLVDLLAQSVISCMADDSSVLNAAIVQQVRVNFKFDVTRYAALQNSIDWSKYDVRELSATEFYNYTGSVVPNLFWRNAEIFTQHGVAFAIYHQGKLASVAFTSCRDESILELGIETNPEFRGLGLAKIVCARLIDYTLAHNLEPILACRKGNQGSYNLAQSLGFVAVRELAYYQFKA